MSRHDVDLLAIQVEERRNAVLRTARELQTRLQPGKLANEAWEATKAKGADLAEDAVDAVRARPYLASGAVAALALFFAREPVGDGISSLLKKVTDRKTAPSVEEEKPKARATKPKPKTAPPKAAATVRKRAAASKARTTTRKKATT